MSVATLIKCGRISYPCGLQMQQMLMEACRTRHANSLLFLEHPPTYTIGIRQVDPANDYSAEAEQKLRQLGADFHRANRGGLITFHGPGQLVAYPIFNLRYTPGFRNSIKWFVCQLEETIINVCRHFGLTDARRTSDIGVWVGERKIAAIGVHCSNGVTSHGLALNCDIDLAWFQHIVPCGLVGKRVTSLAESCDNISVTTVVPIMKKAFENTFHISLETVDLSDILSETEKISATKHHFHL